MKKTVIAIACLALLALNSAAGFWLGERRVRSEYEVWRTSASAFEGQLVETAQNAKILYEFKKGDPRCAELLILGQVQYGLQNIDVLVSFTDQRDRDLAHRTMSAISHLISEVRPPPDPPAQEHLDLLLASSHTRIAQAIQSIVEKTSKAATKE